ncbi:heavy metal-responsive transcriptional regulator [Luteimonas gilva]|uniref:Heavy metal-responsive transcriptional regulator n=1 Tax=Luteimonas gilva TaxID=2572684 RepID=A0A4U5JX38_9GAMM|nr:heavy metal-responsive transcriptional regulator [Luteimonas gilva]TKR33298.1 heavy metal-responsive transcriptional regulator [Luteimonas gilva]
MRIGEVANRAGVGVDTVRLYERLQLLPAAERTASGYRTFGPDDLERLRFIRRAKGLGFTLDETRELLRLASDRAGERAEVMSLARNRLDDIEQKIAQLTAMRDSLGRLVQQCSGSGPVQGCPIIDAVLAHDIKKAS